MAIVDLNTARRVIVTEELVQIARPLSAATVSTLIANELGGATVADEVLLDWASCWPSYAKVPTYNATYAGEVDSATLEWPDGSAGTYTTTARSAVDASLGMVDAFTVTHTVSGKTVTQTAVTRNSDGLTTNKPVMTVA